MHGTGMTYGEIPYKYYEEKTESTPFTDVKDDYFLTYARDELSDRSMEKPAFEHSERYGPNQHSESMLNLRYDGTRGKVDYPNHPDLFIGHMDNDPRGANNVPDFTKVREQMKTRAELLEIRMGENNEGQIADSPWNAVNFTKSRLEIDKRVKDNTKVFLEQRENDVQQKHSIIIDQNEGQHRQLRIDDAQHANITSFVSSESGQVNAGQKKLISDAPWRNTLPGVDLEVEKYGRANATGLVDDNRGGVNRHVQSSHEWSREDHIKTGAARQIIAVTMATALKLRGTQDSDLGTSMVGSANKTSKIEADLQKTNRQGVNEEFTGSQHTTRTRKFANQADDLMSAGKHVEGELTDESLHNYLIHNDHEKKDKTKNITLHDANYGKENVMQIVKQKYDSNPSEAIKYVLANASNNEHLTNLGNIIIKSLTPGSNPENVLKHALANVTDNTHLTDHSSNQGINVKAPANPEKALRYGDTTTEHGTHQINTGSRGVTSADDATFINRKAAHDSKLDSHQINTIMIARGLKEGTTASKRQIAGSIIMDGIRADTHMGKTGRGIVQTKDVIATANQTLANITPSAVAGLQTHKYSSGKMQVEDKVTSSSVDKQSWRMENEQRTLSSRKADEWRSATENKVSAPEGLIFGGNAEVGGSASVVKPKTLRPTEVDIDTFEF
jgi:hypothetical protein